MAPPQLTEEQAKAALNRIYDRFQEPGNKTKLINLVAECNKEENPMMAKMMKFPKLVSELLKDLMEDLGFAENEIMPGVLQIQMHAAKDASMANKVAVLQQAFTGNMAADSTSDMAAEVCD